ncbi:MAG: sialidase family protein [Acidimicrobiales bacterium]
MKRRRTVAGIVTLLITGGLFTVPGVSTVAPAGAQTAGNTRAIPAAGTTSIRELPFGADGLQQPEIRNRRQDQDGPASTMVAVESPGNAGEFNRHRPRNDDPFPRAPLPPPRVRSSDVAGSDAELSVDGLNHRDQRLANSGNQFSLEPPDQGLCVGNGFVVETTNSVLRVRDTSGAPLTGVQDLNTFLQYPAAIDRAVNPPVIGPNVIDPVCLYDPDFGRFVVAVTTLHALPDGAFTGKNTIDVAVSNTDDPTGAWTVYKIPAQNDGADGTPNHGCTTDGTTPGPCFQDYPHIGADRNGVYIATNEYDLFGPNYSTANVFAFSKQELAAHGTIRMTLVENLSVAGTPGFTVWPAISPPREYSNERGGTEYFLSTIAGDGSETGNPTRSARKIGVWALSNTRSLNSATPDLRMTNRLVDSQTYVFPPLSTQPAGDFPLGQCVNDTTIPLPPLGTGCWNLFFLPADEPAHDEVISTPDSLDSRMQQTWFVNGQLWGSSGTAVRVDGEVKAGIAWFRVDPRLDHRGRIQAEVERQGYIALADNDLSMPAIAMTPEGEGVIAFTVMGETFYPTAGYARIDDRGRVGRIRIAAPGVGVDDGFTSYKAFVGDPPRTRWGDYGAAVTDGDDIWIASEYIAQTCTLQEYLTGAIGSCDGTRTSLGNWATRLTKLDT